MEKTVEESVKELAVLKIVAAHFTVMQHIHYTWCLEGIEPSQLQCCRKVKATDARQCSGRCIMVRHYECSLQMDKTRFKMIEVQFYAEN